MKPEIKLFREADTKALELKENRVRIEATVMGVPDREGDVIFPGAYENKVLRAWEKEGWLDNSHGWDNKTELGIPIKASLGTNDQGFETLILECEYHDDPASQAYKSKIEKRLAKGLKVSASQGFMPDYGQNVEWFENGEAMVKFIADKGYDETKFDLKAIKKLGWCRAILKVRELFEISICSVGMHRGARAIESKDLTNVETLVSALSGACGLMQRAHSLMEFRGGDQGLTEEESAQVLNLKTLIKNLQPSSDTERSDDQKAVSDFYNLKLQTLTEK